MITGGTRGIGRGIAAALLAEGVRVVLNGRSADKGRQALEELAAGDAAHFIAGNVQRQQDVEALIDGAIAHFGRIDILVNNAGGSSGFAPVAELSDEAWNEALNWMLNSTFWATRRALRDMIPRRWGRIINVSSVEGKRVNKPSVAHYVANKHAIHGLTKAVALEHGSLGITCNAICPGAAETDLMKTHGPEAAAASGLSYEEFLATYAREAATGRLTTVEEVSAMALLLASGQGAGITGAIVDVHGGTVL